MRLFNFKIIVTDLEVVLLPFESSFPRVSQKV